jgi:hypothetical protein
MKAGGLGSGQISATPASTMPGVTSVSGAPASGKSPSALAELHIAGCGGKYIIPHRRRETGQLSLSPRGFPCGPSGRLHRVVYVSSPAASRCGVLTLNCHRRVNVAEHDYVSAKCYVARSQRPTRAQTRAMQPWTSCGQEGSEDDADRREMIEQ